MGNWLGTRVGFRCFHHSFCEITLANDRMMSSHSRHASGEVIEALQRQPDAGLPVFHWFSGPLAHAQKAADMGAWFCVRLPMARSRRALAMIGILPRNRVLNETDAPFASTSGESYPTKASSSPVAALARLWGLGEQATQKQLNENLRGIVAEADRFRVAASA
ncbi:TatD family hydrolase [Mesorhizobium sp. BAC0120]|uniref:TatD family hydrolase n=1 Tax=Mesorhizobium sp. BAC0120 TaxID=3090670 RepID=UPI00298D3128|nr:TatD family hydrolase [Mesorhizobium sp. BAC0120]MDW6023310.1 TatD family hydrolase [Mesorhizobium sp. BAC0120]